MNSSIRLRSSRIHKHQIDHARGYERLRITYRSERQFLASFNEENQRLGSETGQANQGFEPL